MSAQAVGGAVGHNKTALIIPCHRVVGSDGSLTGYAGGLERKAGLLALEGAHWDFVSLQLLLQKIRPLLGRFELPKAFVVSPFFRETTSGKVVRTLPENAVFYPVHQLRVSEL